MNAVLIRARGGPEVLALGSAPAPQPDAHEIVIRVHAAAVTPTELEWTPTWTTRGGDPRPFPIIPGHELSGEVDAVGTSVTDLAPGDLVFGMSDWFRDGAQAELCIARAADVALKPRSIDHALAATVPISALTAWQGLIDRARLAAGERVLIHGAAGGVGLFAVQLARWRGAHVVGTVSAHNLDFVRGLGADEVVDYRARPFEEVARDVDVVFDTVGGETLARSWPLLRPGGRLVTVTAAAEHTREPRARDAFFIVEPSREQLTRVATMIDTGELRAVLGASFPLAEARRAYEHKPARGKVVLQIRP